MNPPNKWDKGFLFVVACALIDNENRVLLAKRPEGKSLAGLYEFPGGKLEENETPEIGLIRELKEELNINVQAQHLHALSFTSHTYANFHLFMPLYLCRHFSGIPKAMEGQELQWVSIENIDNYKMPAADLPLIPSLKTALL